MEKQTMKVMWHGEEREVDAVPVISALGNWCFKDANGIGLPADECTLVPEKPENDLERARRIYENPNHDEQDLVDAYESAISRLTADAWTTKVHKLPDHHNRYGQAWWADENISEFVCERSVI